MTRISNEILRDIYFEICEEQNIDIDSCEVYVKEKSMKTPIYWGDDLTEGCFKNYSLENNKMKTDIKELAKEIAVNCYSIAYDNYGSNNGTTYLDYYNESFDIQNIDIDELCEVIAKLENVIQVDFNNFNDDDICIVFKSMKKTYKEYDKLLNKKEEK
jgi:hypothetical protein